MDYTPHVYRVQNKPWNGSLLTNQFFFHCSLALSVGLLPRRWFSLVQRSPARSCHLFLFSRKEGTFSSLKNVFHVSLVFIFGRCKTLQWIVQNSGGFSTGLRLVHLSFFWLVTFGCLKRFGGRKCRLHPGGCDLCYDVTVWCEAWKRWFRTGDAADLAESTRNHTGHLGGLRQMCKRWQKQNWKQQCKM